MQSTLNRKAAKVRQEYIKAIEAFTYYVPDELPATPEALADSLQALGSLALHLGGTLRGLSLKLKKEKTK